MKKIKKSIQNRIAQTFITEIEKEGFEVKEAPMYDRHKIFYAKKPNHMTIELGFHCCPYEKPSISISGRRYEYGCSHFDFFFKIEDPTDENIDERFKQMFLATKPYMNITYKDEDRRKF